MRLLGSQFRTSTDVLVQLSIGQPGTRTMALYHKILARSGPLASSLCLLVKHASSAWDGTIPSFANCLLCVDARPRPAEPVSALAYLQLGFIPSIQVPAAKGKTVDKDAAFKELANAFVGYLRWFRRRDFFHTIIDFDEDGRAVSLPKDRMEGWADTFPALSKAGYYPKELSLRDPCVGACERRSAALTLSVGPKYDVGQQVAPLKTTRQLYAMVEYKFTIELRRAAFNLSHLYSSTSTFTSWLVPPHVAPEQLREATTRNLLSVHKQYLELQDARAKRARAIHPPVASPAVPSPPRRKGKQRASKAIPIVAPPDRQQ